MATYPPNVAHFDANQVPTVTGVIGTLGTADVGGTALPLPVGVNPATGAMYVQDLAGGAGTSNVQGSVTITGGTFNAGTVVVSAGTQQTLGTVGVINSVAEVIKGTTTLVSTVSNLTNGSVNILTGTLQSSGTTTGVGVVSNVTNGSVNILTGTLQSSGTTTGVGVVSNVTNGSINILTGTLQSSGTTTGVGVVSALTTGSLTDLATIYNVNKGTISRVENGSIVVVGFVSSQLGTAAQVTTVSNLTNGSVNLLTGTVTSVTNIAGGTTQLNPVPVPATLQFGTLGTAGGSFFGTISAASGAGTKHYITGYTIVQQAGTSDVRILAGTSINGTGVIAAGNFPAGGGIARIIEPAFATGTNSELVYHFVGAGSAYITVSYWKGV